MLTVVKFIHDTEKTTEITHIQMITAIVRPFPKCHDVFSGWQITMYLKRNCFCQNVTLQWDKLTKIRMIKTYNDFRFTSQL